MLFTTVHCKMLKDVFKSEKTQINNESVYLLNTAKIEMDCIFKSSHLVILKPWPKLYYG